MCDAVNVPEACPGAPQWEPEKWRGVMEFINNCYAYAVDDCRDRGHGRFPHPAGKNGLSFEDCCRLNVRQLVHCVEMDGLRRAFIPVPKPGHYLVALAVEGGHEDGEEISYHWWRQDRDGFWSHKPGQCEPCRTDKDGKMICDPRLCNRGGYKLFVGYFHVPEGGLEVDTVNFQGSRHSIPLPQPKFR